MKDKIVVAVLGNRKSGKSRTWNTLFGHTVRTGNRIRRLFLSESEWVDVFLVSGSPEERHTYVGDIIGKQSPSIVLCSMQYRVDVVETIDYFLQHGYAIYAQWLNPGYSDATMQADSLGPLPYLLNRAAVVSIRDGQVDPEPRVYELRDFIYGWARSRSLIQTSNGPLQPLDPNEDDSLIDELLESNPRFQTLAAKSKAGPRMPFHATGVDR